MKILNTISLCIICTSFYAQSFNFSKIAEFESIQPEIYIDFNDDGVKDLIAYQYDYVNGYYERKLVIYEGNDKVEFQNRFNVIFEINVPFSYGRNIQVGDFDGDGDLDLIDVTRDFTYSPFGAEFSLYIIKNNDFVFEIIEMGSLNSETNEIWSGDYNNDGKTDLFSSFGTTGYLDSLSVIEFEGDSINSNTTIMSFDYFDLEVTDINEDGQIEIFGHDNDDDRLDIIFLDSLDYSSVLSVQDFDLDFLFKYSENLVDLDRNGVMDLVYEVDDSVYCIYNIETGGINQVPAVIDSFESDSYIDVVFFDFDGDDKTELLVENGSQFYVYNKFGDSIQKSEIKYSKFLRSSNNFHLETDSISGKQLYLTDDSFITEITVNSDSSVDYEVNTLLNSFGPNEFIEVKMTDVNMDGYDDVLYFSNGSGIEIGVMYGNEDGSFRKREIIVDEVKFPRVAKFEDFNNDGAIDIIYTSIRSSDMVLLQNVDGIFMEVYKFDRAGYEYNFVTSDFDDDGFEDIVLYKFSEDPNSNYDSKLEGLRNISGQGFELVELDGVNFRYFPLVADLDHDGKKEFIDYQYDGDEISIYQIGEGSVQKYTQPIVGSWRDMHQFNLDGTGNAEVVFWDYDYDEESYRINIYEYDSEQVKLDFQCKSEDLFGKRPEEFLFFDYNNDGYNDIIAFTADNGSSGRVITLFEYNGSTLVYKGELSANVDYNTNIVLEDFIFIDTKNGLNRYLVIDQKKAYLLNGEERTEVTLCTYLDENQNNEKEENESNVASSEIVLTKNNTSFSFITQNSGCTVANLPEAKYAIDLDLIDCLTQSIEDSIYLEVDTTYQFPLIINDDQGSVLVDITRAHSRCSFFARYWIQVSNLTCNDFSGTLNVYFDENSQNVEPLLGGELIDSHTLNYIIEDLAIGGKLKFEATVQIPSSDFLSFPLHDSYDLSNDNTDTIAMGDSPYILRCAFDPNDKSIQPDRTLDYGDQYILNEELEYLIRFENVGNDSAINIKVIDTISGNLDLSTLKILSASHDYRYTLNTDTRVLTVYFDDIYLPDNKTNEPESHGFFKFRIMPVAGLDEFTSIKNDAQIYFDFNSPILTNVVNSIFISDLSLLNSVQYEEIENLIIFPNPTNGIVYFQDKSKIQNSFSGTVYNSWGQRMLEFQNVGKISLVNMNFGIYFIRMDDGKLFKVILAK